MACSGIALLFFFYFYSIDADIHLFLRTTQTYCCNRFVATWLQIRFPVNLNVAHVERCFP
jgi:hypothetical protein